MWYKVKELREGKLSKSQISRELGVDRATVRKYLEMGEDEFHLMLKRGRNLPLKLAGYLDYVRKELEVIPDLSAAQIEDKLKERYEGLPEIHSKTVYNFVQMVRQKYRIAKPTKGKWREFGQIPLIDYGHQAQVDFGEYYMSTGEDKRVKVHFFVMVLSRSRYKFVYFQGFSFTTATAVYAHSLAFEYFQGIPKNILYDQDSVFIHDENLGDYQLTHEFQAYSKSQPFTVVFCRKADPQSKGKVENVVKYVKNNFLRGRVFIDIPTLNRSVLDWLSRTANAKMHSSTFKIPQKEWETEKQYLLPLKEKIKEPENTLKVYNVRKDNTVAYRSNFYTLPLGTYQGRKTTVLLSEVDGTLNLFSMDNTLIATHPINIGKGELVRNSDHSRDKSKSYHESSQQVLQLLGGDEKGQLFLDLLRKDKPRYYHDNLKAIIKGTKDISTDIISKSLMFCLENKVYNGAGFCQVARNYLREKSSENSPKINRCVSYTEGIKNNADINVPTSNINTYQKLMESWTS
jgi:transposase